jgi:hypothetical protein
MVAPELAFCATTRIRTQKRDRGKANPAHEGVIAI